MSSWWEDPGTDWGAGRPGRVADVLSRAYETPQAIRPLIERTGLEWRAEYADAAARATWIMILARAATSASVLDLMAEVLQDRSSAAFHHPLTILLGPELRAVQGRRVLWYGASITLLESTAEPPDPGDRPLDALQAITSTAAGLSDPQAYLRAMNDAVRRLAMIQVGGRPRGTGVLVGPDLLITAAHVFNPRELPPPGLQDVDAVFDFFATPRSSPAETGTKVAVTEFICGSLPTPGELAGSRDFQAPPDRLDFALVRLAAPVPAPDGSARGHYPLSDTQYDFAAQAPLWVFQHPLGEFQMYSKISTPTRNAAGTRVRYRCNTMNGSSGGPVIDERGTLVALHHYSPGDINQGVPISAIAAMVRSGPHAALLNAGAAPLARPRAADPFSVRELLGRPFVNRENLRRHVSEMAAPTGGRTLVITGARGSGITYSYRLLAHVASRSTITESLRQAAPAGLVALTVNLRHYVDVPVAERRLRIIGDICVSLGLSGPGEPIAQEARNTTTFKHWLHSRLRHSDKQWWLFFDSLDDAVAAGQGGVNELIHAIIDLAQDPQVPLRVALGGWEADRFADGAADWAQRDTVSGLNAADVERWLRTRAEDEGRQLDDARLSAELASLFPDGQPPPLPAQLAPRLPAVLVSLLEGGR
ncbi:serine protease [Acrocarpospora sp. B8E8]|uniref:trypsin-like serine peptidase n=1 Tax=Acrocarpospora sp. B8E8 TaxID=3153572 RepID=UPI00325F60F1